MSILKICLTLTLTILFNGCCYKTISEESLWFDPVYLSEQDKKVLSDEGKQQIAENNCEYYMNEHGANDCYEAKEMHKASKFKED